MKSQLLGFKELWEDAPRWRYITSGAVISTVFAVLFWPSASIGLGSLGQWLSASLVSRSAAGPSRTPATLFTAAVPEDTMELYNLGLMYFLGNDVPEDKAEAARCYRKAADQGLAQAQFSLGDMLQKGDGIPENKAEAVGWFRKAGDQGYGRAQFKLGVLYYTGEGVPEDKVEAVEWFRKAAEQGDTAAQNNLGVMYVNGEGVPRDPAEAARLFRQASGQ